MLEPNIWAIVFNIINIIVLFLFLKKFLFKPVTEMMDKRANSIIASLQDADDKKAEAMKIKNEYEEELIHAGEKASSLIKEAKERAEAEYNRKLVEAKEDASKVITEANKIIELERKKSLESAQAEIAGIAMLAAAKVIGKNIDDDTNKQFLGDFLKEVGAAK
ncbi:MAG: F0F1 ATP synthase subunit B [Herbinix sp.]|nr:F0F1 ATP synthase subunit B [Herbinix sp.]